MALRIHGNRLLKTLPGSATRPTPGRVREALFNIWQGKIAGCRWLDLCTGSGAMGAEALCRGAALVIGIEQSSQACEIIQQNWRQVAKPHQTFQVIRGDVVKRLVELSDQAPFDRIYFDPPYASDLYEPVLEAIAHHQLLAPQGEMAVEHSPGKILPEAIHSLSLNRQKTYGNTAIAFYLR
ncbi:MAG: 16S rRNA (guanine(966)-N(2))-methyltransferase RsmD [Timaviella obliquedivisa GSE-PSE-MK23-08B]|jgi:16S rRNA (guanine(966)-N(2))-methyltransferase RsmD|nr:16S rRNA (guanine(966)-N(2))-methyltransferase RsmD [Timaviella obliquedivisa GSE-PSE-MK23-08B]